KKVDEAMAPVPSAGEAKVETTSAQANTEAPAAATANVGPSKIDAPKAEETKAVEKPVDPAKAVAAPAAPAVAPDAKKDAARLPGAEKTAKAEPPRRPGLIAVFVSRKDSKLY